MDIDWKLLVAVTALALSIYNFIESKRTKGLEKRTAVLNEFSEAQLMMSRLVQLFQEMGDLDYRESPESVEAIRKMKEQCAEMNESLDECFEIIERSDSPNQKMLESIRPRLKRILSGSKNIYENTLHVKNRIEDEVSERPKIIVDK